MRHRDNDVIFEGKHHRVIYNENFVAMPYAVVESNSGLRVGSHSSENSAKAAVRHHDKTWTSASVR